MDDSNILNVCDDHDGRRAWTRNIRQPEWSYVVGVRSTDIYIIEVQVIISLHDSDMIYR